MDDIHEIMTSKKFCKNLSARAFFFFGFTLCRFIETVTSFVLNTLLPTVLSIPMKSGGNRIANTSLFSMVGNVPQLPEVGDYEAQIFKLKQMYNRSRNSHITTEPPILVRCCYVPFFFTNK